MAGTERIELPLTEPESVVLPLDEVPMLWSNILQRKKILYVKQSANARSIFSFFLGPQRMPPKHLMRPRRNPQFSLVISIKRISLFHVIMSAERCYTHIRKYFVRVTHPYTRRPLWHASHSSPASFSAVPLARSSRSTPEPRIPISPTTTSFPSRAMSGAHNSQTLPIRQATKRLPHTPVREAFSYILYASLFSLLSRAPQLGNERLARILHLAVNNSLQQL